MTTNHISISPPRFTRGIYAIAVLAGLLSQISVQSLQANTNSYWRGAQSGDWNDGSNWSGGLPNASDANAIFGTSNQTGLYTTDNVVVDHIEFARMASPFSIGVSPSESFTLDGTGLVNHSGITQNLSTNGTLFFTNEARADDLTVITANGGIVSFAFGGTLSFEDDSSADRATVIADFAQWNYAHGGRVEFHGTSDAGTAQLISNGGTSSVGSAGTTSFYENSTANRATVTTNGGTYAFEERAVTQFFDTSTAGNATFTNGGSTIAYYYGGRTEFFNSATAANGTFSNDPGVIDGAFGGSVRFNDTTTAGSANFTNHGAQFSNVFGSFTIFFNSATADHATFTNEAGQVSGAYPGLMQFSDTSTAGDAVITNDGATVGGAFGGELDLYNTVTLGNATIVLNGGANGGGGGMLFFIEDSDGGTARVELFGNAFVDLSYHNVPGIVTIGSLEGDGVVSLAASQLTVGSNNLSTIFAGELQDGGWNGGVGGSLGKTGRGKFILSNANSYTGGTTVSKGTLLVMNRSGSATGTGPLSVNAGTLGGTGKISGTVTIGTVTTAGILSPGSGARPGKLTLSNTLTFNALGNYKVDLNSTLVRADQVAATGVTIAGGATATIGDLGTGTLTSGTVFRIINNSAATPISGTFGNLPDGSTLTLGHNTYLVSYEGGTGNDLTLTVQ